MRSMPPSDRTSRDRPGCGRLIVCTHLSEFETDTAFLDDVRTMLKTSRLMFEWYFRGTPSKTLNESRLAVLADPLPPLVKVYGLNTVLFETGRRKCLIYDLYLAWVLVNTGMPSQRTSYRRISSKSSER